MGGTSKNAMNNYYFSEIKKARERIGNLIVRTPCVYSPALSQRTGKEVFLKLENLQVTGAFKIRGNANKVALLKKEKTKGVITASSGNHGLGLSYAALRGGIIAIVVLPQSAPRNKIEKIRVNKAEIIICGRTYEDAVEYAHFLAEEMDYLYVPSFADEVFGEEQLTLLPDSSIFKVIKENETEYRL